MERECESFLFFFFPSLLSVLSCPLDAYIRPTEPKRKEGEMIIHVSVQTIAI